MYEVRGARAQAHDPLLEGQDSVALTQDAQDESSDNITVVKSNQETRHVAMSETDGQKNFHHNLIDVDEVRDGQAIDF